MASRSAAAKLAEVFPYGPGGFVGTMHRHGITPDLTTPAGGLFLARSCEVTWAQPSDGWHTGYAAFDWDGQHKAAGKYRAPLDGLPGHDPMPVEAFSEMDDTAPKRRTPEQPGMLVPLALLGAAVLVVIVVVLAGSE